MRYGARNHITATPENVIGATNGKSSPKVPILQQKNQTLSADSVKLKTTTPGLISSKKTDLKPFEVQNQGVENTRSANLKPFQFNSDKTENKKDTVSYPVKANEITGQQTNPLQFKSADNNGVVQLMRWKYILNRNGERFEPFGPWHKKGKRPKNVKVDSDEGAESAYREGSAAPNRKMVSGDIYDDKTGNVVRGKDHKAENQKKRKLGNEKRDSESQIRLEREKGVGIKSERVSKKYEQEYKKRRLNSDADTDTGIHHMGGDSPVRNIDFEEEGLHSQINERIRVYYLEQLDAIKKDDTENVEWLKIPEKLRQEILDFKGIAEEDTDIIHHSKGDRPKLTSAVLGIGTVNRPKLNEDIKHTGVGTSKDNLSHSIPYAQTPDVMRHAEEGGVNHPKNIPYENKVTNQVVNVAIENIAVNHLDKKIVKVVVRFWDADRVVKSIHVYFTEEAYPFVFGTRDLKDKVPLRWKG